MRRSEETPVQYVVVLGSKPNSPMPDVNPIAVCMANGAASKGLFYKKCDGVEFVSVVSSKQLLKHEVLERIVNLKPSTVVARFHKSDATRMINSQVPTTVVSHIATREQYLMQKKYFGWRLFWSHLTIRNSKATKSGARGKNFWLGWLQEVREDLFQTDADGKRSPGGVSTGLFSVIYALETWPDATVIMSGIGLVPGPHHYGNELFSSKVAIRDRRVMPHIAPSAKARLYTTDPTMAEIAGIRLWPGAAVDSDVEPGSAVVEFR